MHGDRITLTRSEQRRLLLLNHLQSGALVNAQAASLLGISIRQVRRLRRRYEAEGAAALAHGNRGRRPVHALDAMRTAQVDRKSTRLNSSHSQISYAVFCLKK